MLGFQDDVSRREKCYTTVAHLPTFVDPRQPPTKKLPFSAVLGHPFLHTIEVILPEDTYLAVGQSLSVNAPKLQYARVFMPLSALLDREFFNVYIKSGNILMISEGRSGSDNVFTLNNGILKLELGKEIFGRTGLTGKPVRNGGRKHAKERYLIEIDLRQPSMLHGKRGFERIIWAFNNVLAQSVAWLFCDLEEQASGVANGTKPISKYHPQVIDCGPFRTSHQNILVPAFHAPSSTESDHAGDLLDEYGSLSEWLAMVSLESSRVSADDTVDPYLSRYAVPDVDCARSTNLVSLKWHGFISSKWAMQLFFLLLRETSRVVTVPAWFALLSSALGREAVEGKDGYTVLVLSPSAPRPSEVFTSDDVEKSVGTQEPRWNRHFICWEFIGASAI